MAAASVLFFFFGFQIDLCPLINSAGVISEQVHFAVVHVRQSENLITATWSLPPLNLAARQIF